MKLKKVITIILLTVIIFAQFSFIEFNNVVKAVSEENEETNEVIDSKRFHYNQLDETSKKIYDGIEKMKNSGILVTGTENYDLVANKHFTSEEIASYENGSVNLKSAFYAARYAFYADNPDVFYVDFSKLSIRTTKGSDGYHVYVGAGNNTEYRTEGFDSQEEVENAIKEYYDKIEVIINEANSIQAEAGKNLVEEKVRFVHNKITKITGYRDITDCKVENEGFISTPYGALVKGEAVCEGYSRAFKSILDKMGIDCILVQGLHGSEEDGYVAHMWNYVQIPTLTQDIRLVEKKWYAVDTTLDDPFRRTVKVPGQDYSDREPGWDITEGFENTAYLMVGKITMAARHIAVEQVEAAGNYVFNYPELEMEDLGTSSVVEVNGLVVKYKQEGFATEEYQGGDYFISYNGMGYKAAREEGVYMLVKYYQYFPATGELREGDWGYFNDAYVGGFVDKGTYIWFTVPNGDYMKFAVTNVAPAEGIEGLKYQGTDEQLIAQTEKLYNPSGDYRARPFIKERNISVDTTLTPGKTYHMVVKYDDTLEFKEDATEVGYKIESTGTTGAEYGKVENFTWDGISTIEFDFTPSKMFADDGAFYSIYPTGIVGKNSGKAPMEITYGAVNTIACSFRMNAARNWEMFARPTLLENEDLSLNGWITEDGEEVADKLKNRIALVATETSIEDKETMNDLITDETAGKVLKSETYNISLNACKKYVIKTGHRVRLSVGFPAGYGPEDAGVTFKAYHFIRDSKGNITEVEEIPCVVTQYGLIITCDSFSPFAISAVEDDGTNTTKSLVISSAENGTITAKNVEDNETMKAEGNILEVNEGESKSFVINANTGYQIETVTVCGKVLENVGKYSMEITVNYDDIKDGNPIIDATFVAETVAQEEQEKGEEVVIPKAEPIEITMKESEIITTINESLEIKPTITGEASTQTYQWYKNGEKLEEETNNTLKIEKLTVEDTGAYTLKVKSVVETSTEEATSEVCNVVVKSFDTTITVDETVDLENLKPGEEFNINIAIDNFQNIPKGIYAISGKLEYSEDILEIIQNEDDQIITVAEGWDGVFENHEILEFVTTGSGENKVGKYEGLVGTIRVKVKDDIEEESEAIFKLKNIGGSDANSDINSNDAQIEMKVIIPEKDGITSDVYTINDEESIITEVPVETTVATFKQNITSHGELVFKNNKGNVLTDADYIGTGSTVKVGESLEYTFIVHTDTDGNGKTTPTDLAQIKLHLIKKQPLTGIYLKAADVNKSGDITLTDVAQIKLIIIKMPIEQ